jgi:hypothetical protein
MMQLAEDQLIYKHVIYHTKFKVASSWFALHWTQDHARVLICLSAYILTFNEISYKTYTAINLWVLSYLCQWSQQIMQYEDDSDYR